jgi:hypothetical protein
MSVLLGNTIYRGVFADSPNPYLLLTIDLKIVNGNDAYLDVTGTNRDALANTYMFDAFPDNPADPNANGVANLSASFASVQAQQARQTMSMQRYDVRNKEGLWEARYWNVVNWPILDDNRSIVAIVHHVREVHPNLLDDARAEVARTRQIARHLHSVAEKTAARSRKLDAALTRHLLTWKPDSGPQ